MEPTTAPTAPATPERFTGLSPQMRLVFIGLLLGMFVAGISQTIVSPALPVMVAELGGIEGYSWLATAAMLTAAVVVPIVGKLSDLYGRRPFYLGGLVVFMAGAALAGAAPSFWWLVAARAVQGLGMGALMTLSQTIIGDIVPPRQRGRYQGWVGAVFGVTSVAGPLADGWLTDHVGWRWVFYAGLPFGVIALVFVARNLHLPHARRPVRIDVAGIVTLTLALVAVLLAASWGGTAYPWSSPVVLGLLGAGAVLLTAFVLVEQRAHEPVLPLRLFRSSIFTLANVASLAISMAMFGAVFYIPVYAQGVLGVDATRSGAILVPMSVTMIGVGIVVGLLISRHGHYKRYVVGGTVLMLVGFGLLTLTGYGTSPVQLTAAMVVIGLGIGGAMQTLTLVVQNVVGRDDLGVATASVQFFRNVGATVGIALLGAVMTARLGPAIAEQLPAGTDAPADLGAGSVLDPAALAGLSAGAEEAVRRALADALGDVFLAAVPIVVVAVVASVLLRVIPLRDTLHVPAAPVEEADLAVRR
ncbi:multidrug transporter [Actinotalea ferrariae CF5-4]|uniref:Multidrug transporter n=1 Tax=Actinotalea ferrariae CF5-4 TaxID=948458 RepID=A0A021VPH2_9CELL|nr:MDR family MFS transporter [Actinotalea ferrariae]EYR63084.1 multidrug transporter [Actinotalea ferrariae CF5-4]